MKIRKNIVTKPIKDIKPYARNNKRHPDSQIDILVSNIQEFGFNVPILLDKSDNIVAGHARYLAAKRLGIEELPALLVDDLNEVQIKALRIADNRIAELAETDWDMLRTEMEELDSLDYNLDMTGYKLSDLPEGDNENEGRDVEPDNPDEIETDIVKGDIFKLGNHRLMCGDATSEEDVNLLMNGEKADMVFTDPPYGINLDGDNSKRGKETSLMKGGLKLKSFKDDTTEYAIKAFNICENLNIPIQVWWGANYYAHSIPETNNWLVWDKRVEEKMKNTNSDCELAWVLDGHNSVRIFRHLWNGLIKASENNQKRVHPTQKPIALAEFCFKNYNIDGKSVLDLFGGSGSTLIAAENLNRKCYMMELDPQYCQIIINRWEKLTGQTAEKL